MFRFRSWCMFLMVLFLMLSLMACGQAQDPPPADAGPEENGVVEDVDAADSEKELDRSSLFDLFEGMDNVSYETIITSPDLAVDMTMKTYVKGDKVRIEMAEGQVPYGGDFITIMDEAEGVLYIYHPQENMATKMDMTMSMEDDQMAPEELMERLDDFDYVGRDTIDGKHCQVYEMTEEDATTKMWIWEKHGFPLRIEISDDTGTTVAQFRNISFDRIPDSMFELPAGVEVVDASQFWN